MHGMKRIVCLAVGLSLLLLQGAAASRYCACLDAMSKPSCCEKQMPCCDGGECKMHPDAAASPDMALDLFKAIDAVSSLPLTSVQLSILTVEQITGHTEPIETRVRGPDCASNPLRAPPVQA